MLVDIWFDIYVTNGQNKQTFQIYNFFWIMHSFPIAGTERCKKKNLEHESILYNSTKLSIDWTSREFQNQEIVFSRKIKSSI